MSLQDIIKCTDLLAEKDAIIAELEDKISWWCNLVERKNIGKDGYPTVDAESVRHLHETDPRPMTPAGLVHVSGTVTLNQWVAIRRVQQAILTREQEQNNE